MPTGLFELTNLLGIYILLRTANTCYIFHLLYENSTFSEVLFCEYQMRVSMKPAKSIV